MLCHCRGLRPASYPLRAEDARRQLRCRAEHGLFARRMAKGRAHPVEAVADSAARGVVLATHDFNASFGKVHTHALGTTPTAHDNCCRGHAAKGDYKREGQYDRAKLFGAIVCQIISSN